MRLIEADRERYSDDGKPPVAWEQYLEVAPGLAALDPEVRPEALVERELDPAAWTRAESYWVLTFALDLQVGRTDRIDAFGRACSEARAGATVPAADAAEVAVVRAAELPAVPTELPAPPPTMPAPTALPSFLKVAEPSPISTPLPVLAPVAPVRVALRPAMSSGDRTLAETGPSTATPALPFGRRPSRDYVARLSTPAPTPTPARADRPDATVLGGGPATTPALPFAGAGDVSVPPPPELSVEEHAAFSADLANVRDEAGRTALLAKYRIGGMVGLAALASVWNERLQRDPALAARWKLAYGEHQKSLSKKGG